MFKKSHFMNNEWIAGSGREFSSVDPASGEETWSGRLATPPEVDLAVKAATDAFATWSALTLDERTRYLEVFGTQISAHREELADSICRETGKPHWESLTEVAAMAGKIGLSVQAYRERCATASKELGGVSTRVRYRPHGVLAVFGPFNLPAHLPNAHIVPALVAGNTVVFKPSGQAPLVAETMMRLWEATRLPAGVINMVQCNRETGMALVTNSNVEGVLFTGSLEGGKALHRAVAGNPRKILALEMGGNNPLVVHQITDFRAAAYLTVQSAFITAGQRCTCARRLIVPRGAEGDEFIATLASLILGLRVGHYTEIPEPFMGPVISTKSAENMVKAQKELELSGGKALVPLKRIDRPGAFLSPGLIDVTMVKNRKDLEFFGPLLQVVRVSDFEEAIHEANSTAFGLSAGLLSDNKDLYDMFVKRIRAGIVNWNRQITGASGTMPFGGIKDSGNHRPSGYYATDYCSYPVASMETDSPVLPASLTPGFDL
jgi:succinylglutamic semialdehyde dehydrogenase